MPTRDRRHRASRRPVFVLAAAAIVMVTLVVVLLVSCADHDSPSGPTATLHRPGPVSAPASTVPPEVLPAGHFFRVEIAPGLHLTAAQRQVVDAYRDAAEAYARATRHPGGSTAELPHHWAGRSLVAQLHDLEKLRSRGLAVRDRPGDRSGFVALRVGIVGPGAALQMCLHDGAEAYRRSDGVAVTAPAPDQQFVLELRRSVSAEWRVIRGAPNGSPRSSPHGCFG